MVKLVMCGHPSHVARSGGLPHGPWLSGLSGMSQGMWVKFTKRSFPHYMRRALARFLSQLRKLDCPAPVPLHQRPIHSTRAIKPPSPRNPGRTTEPGQILSESAPANHSAPSLTSVKSKYQDKTSSKIHILIHVSV